METKVCKKCNYQKDVKDFRIVKDCRNGKYYLNSYCRECEKIIKKEDYRKNKERYKNKNKKYYEENQDKIINVYRKKYNAEYYREWRKNNPEKIKEYIKKDLDKIKKDPFKLIKRQARDCIRNGFRRKGYKKNTKTEKLIGCGYDEYIEHLLQTYKENYGCEWNKKELLHIDHIMPLETAKTEEDVIKLSNYKNLQLLKAKDNLKKGKKINYKLGYNS